MLMCFILLSHLTRILMCVQIYAPLQVIITPIDADHFSTKTIEASTAQGLELST